jgi:acetyl esterase/lipase
LSPSILDLPPLPATARIPYGEQPQQFGDLRLPSAEGRAPAVGKRWPVVIALHGGFWRAAYDLSHLSHLCAALTRAGLATWSLEYRKLGEPGGGFPNTLLDVAAGADHLRDLATRYPLDLGRVASLGHSAGGHLALWLAARSRVRGKLKGRQPLPLKGVVALAAVSDLARALEMGLSQGVVREFMGGSPHQFPERYAEASPSELLPLGVEQILLHGTLDDTVPFSLSVDYFDKAARAGDRAALRPLEGLGHYELIDPASQAWPQVLVATRDLLDR